MDKKSLHKVMEDYGAAAGGYTYYAGVGEAIEFVCTLLEADSAHKRQVLKTGKCDQETWERLKADIWGNDRAKVQLMGLQMEIGALISPAHL